MGPELRFVAPGTVPGPPDGAPTPSSDGSDNAAPALTVLTGEALGEGPWLTNVLFRAFQTAAHARGAVRVYAPRLRPED